MGGLYTYAWQQVSAAFLVDHPWCVFCRNRGRLVRATVVDHIKPHKGDLELFWDEDNWQPLCKRCHDGLKQRMEKRGFAIGSDVKGRPVDPAHPWNRGEGQKQ